MSESEASRDIWSNKVRERGFKVVPPEEIRVWSKENGLVRKQRKQARLWLKLGAWWRKIDWDKAGETAGLAIKHIYLPMMRAQSAMWENETTGAKPWYMRTPKRGWAWLIRPLQFVRERRVAFGAVAVIVSWALLLYVWVVYRVR